jgi:hypothetical protein
MTSTGARTAMYQSLDGHWQQDNTYSNGQYYSTSSTGGGVCIPSGGCSPPPEMLIVALATLPNSSSGTDSITNNLNNPILFRAVLFGAQPDGGTMSIAYNVSSVSAVPIPSSIVLFGSALFCVACCGRVRKMQPELPAAAPSVPTRRTLHLSS